jgi:hypothetical protein
VSGRTLAFVDRARDAERPRPDTDYVVLDTAWTPRPGDGPVPRSIRPVLTAVLRREDLFDGSLAALDQWADAARLAEAFTVDDVTWWYRVRMIVRWDAHALLLWRHVLDELAPPGRYDTIVVPRSRPTLAAAARAPSIGAERRPVPVVREAGDATDRLGEAAFALRRKAVRTIGPGLRDRLRRIRELARWRPRHARRDRLLEDRVAAIRARPGGVLAIASAGFFQVIGSGRRQRRGDPHLELVLERFAQAGRPVVTVGLALDHRKGADWRTVAADDRLVPVSMLARRWSDPGDAALPPSGVAARLATLDHVPIDVAGWDLGPAMAEVVRDYEGTWLDGQRLGMRRAERLLRDLRPGVVFVDHEGVRTLWLAAARRAGIPIVAIQHGVIYRANPEYCHDLHPALVRPDTTCVFGPFERDLLIEQGHYAPGSVVVTGSARSDPTVSSRPETTDERAEVRRELGVRDGDRLLVVSVAHNPIAGDLHSAEMVARLLGGPLPGVHLVFKLHPQDRTRGPFAAMLRGLAAAGGYAAPPISVVRDTDLYRLLRAADAHLGQYSTVLTDAVVAGTPNLIAVGLAYVDMLDYVASGVATPVVDVDGVRAFMAAPVAADPTARARFLDAHFVPGDAVGRIVAAIESTEARTLSSGVPASSTDGVAPEEAAD